MAGLDPAISLRDAHCHPKRDHRDKPGDDMQSSLRALSLPIQISNSPRHVFLSQRSAAPVLCGAGYAVLKSASAALRRTSRGRAGRWGSDRTHGPRHLATSRLAEVRCPSFDGRPQVRQSHGVPRAVFLRFAPHGPRWASIVRRLAFRQGRQTTAWRPAAWAGRSACGLDRRAAQPHLRLRVIPRPPLPAPCPRC